MNPVCFLATVAKAEAGSLGNTVPGESDNRANDEPKSLAEPVGLLRPEHERLEIVIREVQ